MHQLLHGRDKQASREDIEAAVRSRYALKADRRIASIKAFQEARSVLTPEQQKKLKELFYERRGAIDSKGDGHEERRSHHSEYDSAGGR